MVAVKHSKNQNCKWKSPLILNKMHIEQLKQIQKIIRLKIVFETNIIWIVNTTIMCIPTYIIHSEIIGWLIFGLQMLEKLVTYSFPFNLPS